MSIQIESVLDEINVIDFLKARNKPKETIAHGVYPNAKKCLEEYDTLTLRLQDENDLKAFLPYHLSSTSQVQPYIDQLKQAMTVICTIVELIDQQSFEQNGRKVFGI